MRLSRTLLPFVAALALVLLMDGWNGTFQSEFGRYQDEGMHYVTGLVIRDFLAAGSWAVWSHPMAFALDYYTHLPKVALGNWPPVFEGLQALWSLAFGVSRPTMLVEMAVFTACLAALVARTAARSVSWLLAAAAAAAMIASPLTQAQAAMIMAEIPLALFSLLAILAWVRFLDAATYRNGFWFGAWTATAILTKGNGWVIPLIIAVSIPLLRRWDVLRLGSFWLGTGAVVLPCVPYTLITMSIVTQGWNQATAPSLDVIWVSLQIHHRFVVEVLGYPLYALAWWGAVDRVLLPWARGRKVEPLWMVLFLYGVGILLFHAAVPTSFEERKIYQIAPVLAIFLAAGLDAVRRLLALGIPPKFSPIAAVSVAAVAFFLWGFAAIERFAPGFGPAVEAVMQQVQGRPLAILAASDPVFEDAEAAIIAEWASRNPRPGAFLVRPTKPLASTYAEPDGAVNFAPFDSSAQELAARLARVPVAFVIEDTTNARRPYKHHRLLQEALSNPADWTKIFDTQAVALGVHHSVRAYRFNMDVSQQPVQVTVDLSKKIGVVTTSVPKQDGTQ